MRVYLSIIFLISVVFIGYFLVWPEYQKITVIQSNIEGLNMRISQNEEYLESLRNLKDKLENYKEELSMLDVILPKEFYLPHLFYGIQEMVQEHNLTLDSIGGNYGTFEKSPDIQKVRLSIGISGRYRDFKNFLDSLQHSRRFFSIEKISITPTQEGPFHFSLEINTFFYQKASPRKKDLSR
ncbi:type 4a pilus biogenesis protein PilO [bacterium]|nr:type 4a pilus biogenesis protein PilO [bacterium]